MGIINIEDVEAGMVLAGDVKDRSGTIILAAEADDLFRHNDRNHPAIDRLYHLFVRRHARLRSGDDQNGS